MNKFKKSLSIISATVTLVALCICTMTGIVVSAAEEYPTGSLPEPGKDFYTLEQLFAMSDDEFLALNGRIGSGQIYYNVINYDLNDENKFDYERGISGSLSTSVSSSDSMYVKGETEDIIESALGDTVKYQINSPTFEDDMYYSYIFQVYFPDYELPAERFSINDEQVMEFAKCWFCVDQVFKISYDGFGTAAIIPTPSTEPTPAKSTLLGDVDLNDEVGLSDVTALAKYNLNNTAFPLGSEAALANADVNNDGKVDSIDETKLIEYNLRKISEF